MSPLATAVCVFALFCTRISDLHTWLSDKMDKLGDSYVRSWLAVDIVDNWVNPEEVSILISIAKEVHVPWRLTMCISKSLM